MDMANGALENALLRRALVDPATGLPNTLYLDLIREWERTRAEREGTLLRVIAVTVSGGDAARRRALALELCTAFRRSDLVASEGPERFYILFSVHEAGDTEVVSERVAQAVADVNARLANASSALEADVRMLELPADSTDVVSRSEPR